MLSEHMLFRHWLLQSALCCKKPICQQASQNLPTCWWNKGGQLEGGNPAWGQGECEASDRCTQLMFNQTLYQMANITSIAMVQSTLCMVS